MPELIAHATCSECGQTIHVGAISRAQKEVLETNNHEAVCHSCNPKSSWIRDNAPAEIPEIAWD